MKIILEPDYNWMTIYKEDFTLHFIGRKISVLSVFDQVRSEKRLTITKIEETLNRQTGNFSALIDGPNYILAFVDTVRGYPLFYTQDVKKAVVSNSARRASAASGLKTIDRIALLEFRMAGYVTGPETVCKGLFQLQAGELFVWNKKEKNLQVERYYRYFPKVGEEREDFNIKRCEETTDRIFRRVIENANDAPIWIPLSGGFDSRLIICKLKELGYKRLTAFSYGPKSNYEAKAAKSVADCLDIPWHFIPPSFSRARRLFESSIRRRFWNFADGLSSIPAMNEFEVLIFLLKRKILPRDAVIINGQSGDFITGGHIPATLVEGEPYIQTLVNAIIDKHFSVWHHLKSEKNLSLITDKLLGLLKLSEKSMLPKEELAANIECWEWQERQCKCVVNGQRLYDFLGLKWELPLWDSEFLRFWSTVPLWQRYRQRLYRRYLDKFNYKGLFKGYISESRRWPGLAGLGVKATDKMLVLLLKGKFQPEFVKYASYFGHYQNLYMMYSIGRYFKVLKNAVVPPQARGIIAMSIDKWIEENKMQQSILF